MKITTSSIGIVSKSRQQPLIVALAAILAGSILTMGVPSARADDPFSTYWGAIAYSQTTGNWGSSRHWLAQINAERQARQNCKADDARIVVVVGNYWCALALGDDVQAYGVGWAESANQACENALAACRKCTTNCYIAVNFNTRDDNR